MAWLEKRGRTYHISFFHGGRHYSRTLKTRDPKRAEGAKARLEENLADVERGRLEVPPGTDLPTFLLSDGKVERKVVVTAELTLEVLFARYQQEVPVGVKEDGTRYIEDIHIKHFLRLLDKKTAVRSITGEVLQTYVNLRSLEKGRHGETVSHVTVRKEMGTLASIWNKWALPLGLVSGSAPTRGLLYCKLTSKPPFQTYQQIKRHIEGGKLKPGEEARLWASVFLTLHEIQEVLGHVQKHGRAPWVYPMFVFAARTGARRSEMLRSQRDDFDFSSNVVIIREKKKDRSRDLTFRHVPLSPLLAQVMKQWFAVHPGGRYTICQEADKPVTVQTAHHHFTWALAGSQWAVLSGWHCFRHSFASNCACKGIDQRIIDEWMGHQTEDMRRRYRHLFPHQQQTAMQLVFADGK